MCMNGTGASLALAGLGAGMQAFSVYSQINASNQAAEYNARISEQNAAIMDANASSVEARAADAERRGEIEEKQHRLRVEKLKGTQKTRSAGSGVVIGEGSPLDTVEDTAEWAEFDALTIRHNAAMESFGYKAEAANIKNQSNIFRSKAGLQRAGRRSPWPAVGATLLSSTQSIGAGYGLF